jgi:hypothetical protein
MLMTPSRLALPNASPSALSIKKTGVEPVFSCDNEEEQADSRFAATGLLYPSLPSLSLAVDLV